MRAAAMAAPVTPEFQSNPTSSREYAGATSRGAMGKTCFNPTRPVAGNMRSRAMLTGAGSIVSIQPDQ